MKPRPHGGKPGTAGRNHWGWDEGADTGVAHIRRLAAAGGSWAMVSCLDHDLARIRHLALRRYGCLVLLGVVGSHEEDILVLMAEHQAGADFLAFLEDLLRQYAIKHIVYGDGFDVAVLTPQVRCIFETWDGTAKGLARIHADVRGLEGFELLGVYDTSVMRRFAEGRRSSPGP